jgi:hypothetical protein
MIRADLRLSSPGHGRIRSCDRAKPGRNTCSKKPSARPASRHYQMVGPTDGLLALTDCRYWLCAFPSLRRSQNRNFGFGDRDAPHRRPSGVRGPRIGGRERRAEACLVGIGMAIDDHYLPCHGVSPSCSVESPDRRRRDFRSSIQGKPGGRRRTIVEGCDRLLIKIKTSRANLIHSDTEERSNRCRRLRSQGRGISRQGAYDG